MFTNLLLVFVKTLLNYGRLLMQRLIQLLKRSEFFNLLSHDLLKFLSFRVTLYHDFVLLFLNWLINTSFY